MTLFNYPVLLVLTGQPCVHSLLIQ